jgi:probable F420-dependent oxidoreductase
VVREGAGEPEPLLGERSITGDARGVTIAPPRLVLVLSENWTLTPPRDLQALVRMAVEAEDAGFDAVMMSEHVVLGPRAGGLGRMANPREYALPGNQDPAMPWPSSLVLLSAIAAATTRLRLAACAIIAPLRHPLLLARELGTLDLLSEGRLVVQPTVSWHRDEYEALGVPFERRGRLLDEHLAAWELLWRDTPTSFAGEYYRFEDVYLEPKAWRPDGPRLWLGGESVHPRLLRRIVRYAHGFHPLGQPSTEDMDVLEAGLRETRRDVTELELVGGVRATFPDERSAAPLEPALEAIVPQLERGFGTFCIKPSQFLDDRSLFGRWCRDVVERVARLAPSGS